MKLQYLAFCRKIYPKVCRTFFSLLRRAKAKLLPCHAEKLLSLRAVKAVTHISHSKGCPSVVTAPKTGVSCPCYKLWIWVLTGWNDLFGATAWQTWNFNPRVFVTLSPRSDCLKSGREFSGNLISTIYFRNEKIEVLKDYCSLLCEWVYFTANV